MKFNRIAGLALAGICTLTAARAYAEDTVAVMKLDVLGDNLDTQATDLLNSIRDSIMNNNDLILDANGGDITYTEMQMVTGCDKEASIACYDAACETLGAPAIIFGSVNEGGETHLVWYVSGKGIFREANGVISDKMSADELAQKLIFGEKGSLVVTSNVPGADVFIDGKRVGMSAEYEENAQPIKLVAGNYIVAVRKDGFTKEDAVKVVIEGGKTASIHVDMAVASDPEAIRKGILIGGYSSLGVGLATLVSGIVVAAITKVDNKRMNDNIKKYANGGKDSLQDYITGGIKGYDFKKINAKGDTMSTASSALLGVGGFITAAGIALVVTGFVYDFAGEDIDKGLAYNPYIPDVNVNISQEYQGMSLGWKF